MATRLKTVHYAFPTLASLTNNTLTTLSQITIYLPETGTKTFRSVVANVTFDDIVTATGGSISTEILNLRLGAAGYASISNTNVLTNSGENASFWLAQDYTAHFQSNWTGASMTCDMQLHVNQTTGTTLGMVNVCVTLEITYEYDDTSAVQVKTVMLPLDMPTVALGTGVLTYDTIQALDTYLPESTKAYRNIHLVVNTRENRALTTTNHTLTLRVGSATVTTGNYVGNLASDRTHRYVWNLTSSYPSTAATQTWQPTSSVSRSHHGQAYLVVTYEFREDLSTRIMNSLMLPMEVDSPFGGPTAADYQRSTRDLWIQEPGTISKDRTAFFLFWTQLTEIGGLNMRVGTGSFVSYTGASEMNCGSNCAMVRDYGGGNFVRGKNVLNFDAYRTDTADFGWNVSGYWLVNYTSDKAASGSGSHNHTVYKSIVQQGTAAVAAKVQTSALSFLIPETDYFTIAVGTRLIFQSSGTVNLAGFSVQVERLAAEGGISWENGYRDIQQTDAEVGVFHTYSQMRTLFKRFIGDDFTDRIDMETARRWRIMKPLASQTTGSGWTALTMICSYHSITYPVEGTLSGGFTGTVNLTLWRDQTGEKVKVATRSGDGTFSFTWYDDTLPLFVEASDATHSRVSLSNTAGSGFNIAIPSGGSGGPKYYAG